MTSITNMTRAPLDFVVGVKDGEAKTEVVRPGETRSLTVDTQSAFVKGLEFAGAIKIGAKKASPAAAA